MATKLEQVKHDPNAIPVEWDVYEVRPVANGFVVCQCLWRISTDRVDPHEWRVYASAATLVRAEAEWARMRENRMGGG